MTDQRMTEREVIALAYSDEASKNWTAPVQGYPGGIPWPVHLEAYEAYVKRHSQQTALINLKERGCRGGFHVSELDDFIPGWRDRVTYFGRLATRVEEIEKAEAQRAADIEIMGRALTALSDKLRTVGFLDLTANHLTYDAVVKAWEKFQ